MKFFTLFVLILFAYTVCAQTNQVSISRVDQMPDSPAPYEMRDWKAVANQYDAFIFNQTLSGEHLPLLTLKPNGRNFPEIQPIQLDTYVGTTSQTQAEAINIIPAIVGASLVGIDKSNQSGVNWVEKIKDFYNSANGQNVYLNGTNSSSGNDWWYDVMPNVFFYQTYSLYPGISGFENQFINVADRWLDAVRAMGGKSTPWTAPSMNYRGWYLSSMTGNTNGVKEPEAAGSIAWLLYHAYSVTGDEKYLLGAQTCIEYLNSLNSNPSYELQLPYGIQVAAKLNATMGSGYDIEKMLNWTFDRGELRGWGTIVGNWDGMDVSGLIGEANDAGNDYAFMMNGYQHAAALVPLVKYDKRFARAIAKWVLNLANASRFFYSDFRPEDRQDAFAWSNQYDPASVIGYEALKENMDGKKLFATGDAKRSGWAATNLALYGSSHVGYLASIIDITDVEKILRVDLNKTDFFGDHTFASAMLYNPYPSTQQVTLNEGAGPFDVYDAISESMIAENVSGNFTFAIPANEVVLLTILPDGTATSIKSKKLYAGEHVIDYHYGYDFTANFRIKSLAADKTSAEFTDVVNVYATIENAPAAVSYKWYIDDVFQTETTTGEFQWPAMDSEGVAEIKVEAISNSIILKDSLTVTVTEVIPSEPVFTEISMDQQYYISGNTAKLIAHVQDSELEEFTYDWIVPAGVFLQDDSLITWTTPQEGLYAIRCIVTNSFQLSAERTVYVLIKNESTEVTEPLAYYPLNNDVMDYSGNDHHATVEGTQKVDDALGLSGFARRFASGNDVIRVSNDPILNFGEAITLAFWMSPSTVGHEAFLLSHGSWEERWKVSITPSKKLRWTVRTGNGTVDLDSSDPLVTNEFIHVTVVYTGYSMEMYINGVLDSFVGHGGDINTTAKNLTFGQKDYDDRQYYYNGVLDEVRIYDKILQPDEISLLQTLWMDDVPTPVEKEVRSALGIFPNPSSDGRITIEHPGETLLDVQLIGSDGKWISSEWSKGENSSLVRCGQNRKGIYILRIVSRSGVSNVKVILN
jgi:hypothetical protein